MSTNNNIKEGLSAIAKEVLQDAGKEAERTMKEAEAQAKETLRLAKETADQTYKTIIDEATAQTLAEKRKVDSTTEVETRNQLLQTKQDILEATFEKALAKLQESVKAEGYHEQLLWLIEESVLKMSDKSLVVRLNAEDMLWLTRERLSQLAVRLHTSLDVAKKPEKCLGGCAVQTLQGDVVYNNTLEARLERFKPELRAKVAKIIFEEAKDDAG